MNDYSSLFTSGLMLLCDSGLPRSRQPSPAPASVDARGNLSTGLRSFLSLDMAESLRTFATGSSSSSAAHSRKPSAERRPRILPSPASYSSVETTRTRNTPASPTSPRRRSLPQPKPVPLQELPVLPNVVLHTRSSSDSAASSPVVPDFILSPAPLKTMSTDPSVTPGPSVSARRLAPATPSLKLEVSSAPATPSGRFPTTPNSSRMFSTFSSITSRSADDVPWGFESPTSSDPWADAFATALSPTTSESALGLHFAPTRTASGGDHPTSIPGSVPKRARARRSRHPAVLRNASVATDSTRSSASPSTQHRRVQRNGALARLEGRAQRSEWMSDDEDSTPVTKSNSSTSKFDRLAPPRTEDQSFSFMDLSDDITSLAARRSIRSLIY